MAPPSPLFLIALSRLFIRDISCVGVSSYNSLVRAETVQKAEVLSSNGEMMRKRSKPAADVASEPLEDTVEHMCNIDFPVGVKDSCDCRKKDEHELILKQDQCEEAARQAGISTTILSGTFRISYDWFEKRPAGCFMQPCKEDPNGNCYFFDPIGTLPAQCQNTTMPDGSVPKVTGVPICKRARYLNGTQDQNGGCPAEYGVIMDEANCSNAAECLGYCQGTDFKVTHRNQSRYNDFPLGCFINSRAGGDGCVYYNPPLENWKPPHSPVGTPLCNVSRQTWTTMFVGEAGGHKPGEKTATTDAAAKTTDDATATTADAGAGDAGDNTTAT